MPRWDIETDVVCVGAGLGGCATALAAADHGFATLLLEKDVRAGGKTSWSNGGIWIPGNDLARDAGIADSLEEGRAYLRFLAAGYAVDENLNAYIDQGPSTLRYFSQLGIRFQLVRDLPDIYYGMAPGTKAEGRMIEIALSSALELGEWRDKVHVSPYRQRRATFDEAVRWGGRGSTQRWDPEIERERERTDMRALGEGIIVAFVKALLDRKVPIEVDAPVRRLVVEDGRVTGLIARIDGREQAVRARAGVVLTAGGYESNPMLVKNFDDIPFHNQFPDTLNGDALIMAGEIGAAVRVIPRQLTLFLGYETRGTNGDLKFRSAGTQELPFPHSIAVNQAGRRFGDESFFQKLLNGLRDFDVTTHTYRNLPCYYIFSRQFVERYSFAGARPGTVPDYVARGETPEALAAVLGIDPAGLRTEVERFNTLVAKGHDDDFGRGDAPWSRFYGGDLTYATPNLGTLEPPFYGIQLHPTGMSSAGLLTNAHAQVIDLRGRLIPGLYASGDCAAYIDFGIGFQAGLSLGRNLIFGLAAVKDITTTKR
jgi:3-oxosteroid 1-dehydrogenase